MITEEEPMSLEDFLETVEFSQMLEDYHFAKSTQEASLKAQTLKETILTVHRNILRRHAKNMAGLLRGV